MKIKFIIILLIFSTSFSGFGQSVIQESAPRTAEQKRVQKVEAEILKLQDDFAKADEQYNTVFYKIRPLNVVLNPTREKLDKKILDNEQVLYEMQRLSLKSKCKQINILEKSIGSIKDKCASSLENRSKKLNDNIKNLRKRITQIEVDATKKKEEKQRTLTFAKPTNDDFWNGNSDKTVKKIAKNSDNDFWNGKSEKIAENDKEDDFWNGKEKETATKISSKSVAINEDVNLEIAIDEYGQKTNLKQKGTNVLIFPKGKFAFFEKHGDYFKASKQDWGSYSSENIRRYNIYCLFDKKGKEIIKNVNYINVDEYSNEIKVDTYKSILYKPKSVNNGPFGTTRYTHQVVYKIDIYDLKMNLKTTRDKTIAISL